MGDFVSIEVQREAGKSGDAQQQGMAYHLKDHAAEASMMTWQTLRPTLLITVKKCGHKQTSIMHTVYSHWYTCSFAWTISYIALLSFVCHAGCGANCACLWHVLGRQLGGSMRAAITCHGYAADTSHTPLVCKLGCAVQLSA